MFMDRERWEDVCTAVWTAVIVTLVLASVIGVITLLWVVTTGWEWDDLAAPAPAQEEEELDEDELFKRKEEGDRVLPY